MNIPQLRFPEFKGEWEKKKLGEVAEITTGSTPSTAVDEYYNGNRLFVSPADLQGNRFIVKTKTTLSELGFSKGRKIKKGSVLFVCIGSTIGKVGIAMEDCLTNQQINALNAKDNFENNFIYTLLELNGSEIKLLAGVQAVPQINKTDFSNLQFSFPTLPEQTKIATFLTAVDEKIQALKKKHSLLEQYKKGVMQKLFSQALRFKDENGHDFPDWEVKKLGDVCSFFRGSPISKTDLIENGKYKCIHYGELFTKYNEIINYVFSNSNKENGFLSKIGDILMPSSDVTPKGLAKASSIQIENVILGGDMNILRPNKNINSKYLCYLLNHNTYKIIEIVSGTTVKHIYNKDVRNLEFAISNSIEEQTTIANFLSALDDKINQTQSQIEKTEAWKKGLLQKMFV